MSRMEDKYIVNHFFSLYTSEKKVKDKMKLGKDFLNKTPSAWSIK